MNYNFFLKYSEKLQKLLHNFNWDSVEKLAEALNEAWINKNQVLLCGNGGSAANAIHLANDLIYGVSKKDGMGIRVNALPSNQAILTCLGNDISYEDIYSQQVAVLGSTNDVLIVLSGSGNSPNVIKAVEKAKELGIQTFAILGYSGGKCLDLVDVAIHFPIDDMQIAEDCQQIVGHMVMKWLGEKTMGKVAK
jgi:D-sedoheptulose 7-phosphate isomerase